MKQTSDRAFVDSNLIIYLYSKTEPDKKSAVENLFRVTPNLLISNQVLAEVCSILARKFHILPAQLIDVVDEIVKNFIVVTDTAKTVRYSLQISERYKVGFYDALLLATADEFACRTFFTEDLSHDQMIGNLRVFNLLAL